MRAGLSQDDSSLHDERIKLWNDFNHAWLALGFEQKTAMESGAQSVRAQRLMSEETVKKMGDELVRLCDGIERHGLVDYQYGVWEEQIESSKSHCPSSVPRGACQRNDTMQFSKNVWTSLNRRARRAPAADATEAGRAGPGHGWLSSLHGYVPAPPPFFCVFLCLFQNHELRTKRKRISWHGVELGAGGTGEEGRRGGEGRGAFGTMKWHIPRV